ncbi:hypothetical protein IMSAGC011_03334 [Lachnospiraceae bacterium]|nr:hypothetical protein IMSAGC011_03334 [Lachnospiraceae bacterium]
MEKMSNQGSYNKRKLLLQTVFGILENGNITYCAT